MLFEVVVEISLHLAINILDCCYLLFHDDMDQFFMERV